ncbi:hypothetical protein IQ06DRAFT_298225 [Phaeosphaeriaceae sp. SRC1lsM3a]|nr:hypothetical protein IQ06DRAFT_298225 [Stagonospora sp. SRC1lsM3a]
MPSTFSISYSQRRKTSRLTRSESYVAEAKAESTAHSSPSGSRKENCCLHHVLRRNPLFRTDSWDTTTVKELLDQILADHSWGDVPEHELLCLAIQFKKPALVQALLDDDRMDPNITSRAGSTPLHMAVHYGEDTMVKMLLDDNRVDPNIPNKAGRTPIHFAVHQGTESTVKILLHDFRVDATHRDKEGHTPLFYAVEKDRASIIKMLLATMTDTGLPGEETILSRAAQQGNDKIVRVRLDDGRFDPNAVDIFGLTPYTWAKASQNQPAVDMLLCSSAAQDVPKPDPRLEISGRCLRFWMSACDKTHAGACCAKLIEERLPHEIPTWVIDVSRGCIVPGQQVSRYTALSYVWNYEEDDEHIRSWGPPSTRGHVSRKDRLLLKRGNLSEFRKPGYLQGPVADRIPAAIRDSMALVNNIGERYVWVDCLCIIQDDDETRQQVDHMHEVYLGAYLTIIAASRNGLFTTKISGNHGRDMDSSWHDWGAKRRMDGLYHRLLTSKWGTRGWTFQEQIMSKRAVIFLEGDVFWDCQHAVWDQNHLFPSSTEDDLLVPHYETARRMFNSTRPDFKQYVELVGLYNSRDFTYPQDVLPAISGILGTLTQSFSHGFISGLPRLFVDDALLWQPFSKASRRFAKEGGSTAIHGHLPSWSWCGWKCLIDPFSLRTGLAYRNDEESRTRKSSWHTSSLVQWSVLSEDMHREMPIHGPGTSCDHNTMIEDPEVELASGWARYTDGKTTSEDTYGELLIMHESDTKERFRRSIPKGETRGPEPSLSAWPFLSCTTRRALFRIASSLKPYIYFQHRSQFGYNSMTKRSIFTLPQSTYACGPEIPKICDVLCLEAAQGSPAGLLRCMDSRDVIPGEEIELIAISAGSVDYADLQFAYEDSVNRTQECSYPSQDVPFWRVLPGKENERINIREWAPGKNAILISLRLLNCQQTTKRTCCPWSLNMSLRRNTTFTTSSGSSVKVT